MVHTAVSGWLRRHVHISNVHSSLPLPLNADPVVKARSLFLLQKTTHMLNFAVKLNSFFWAHSSSSGLEILIPPGEVVRRPESSEGQRS